MFTLDSLRIFFLEIFSPTKVAKHLTGYEMGIFFSIFVMLQFWNLFNAKYFRTNRSLIVDIVDLFRAPHKVKESYNSMFLAILAVILGGQIVIVTFAGQFFGVAPLSVIDWVWICLLTMPVLLIPDIVRTISR
jgi:Ca2+-transporting ATPase